MSRFDEDPDQPYARCDTDGCGEVHQTKAHMEAHHAATMATGGGRSHTALILNAPRADRILSAVRSEADGAIENALTEFIDNLLYLNREYGVSMEELTEAASQVYSDPDWSGAWAEVLDED